MKEKIYESFLDDILSSLEPKYQDLLLPYYNKKYLYAILPDIPLYYDIFRYSKKYTYNMYTKFHKTKNYEVMSTLKKLVVENNYNADYLLLLIAYISHIMLDYYLDPYIESFAFKTCLSKESRRYKNRYTDFTNGLADSYLEKKTGKKASSVNFQREISGNLCLDESAKKAISIITKDVYYFSFGQQFFELSLEKYQRYGFFFYNDKFGIKRLFLIICDWFSPIHAYSKRGLSSFVPKNILLNDFLNEKNNEWTNNKGELVTDSFEDIIKQAYDNTCVIVKEVLDNIYYQTPITKEVLEFLEHITDNNSDLLEKSKKKFEKFNLKRLKNIRKKNKNTEE